MEEEIKNKENGESDVASDKLAAKVDEQEKRIKELDAENRDLKSKLEDITRKYDKVKAEQESAARRARAEKFVKSLEERGLSFKDDDDREVELDRLACLSDEAFKATEDAYSRMEFPKSVERDGAQDNPGRNSAGANRSGSGSMRSRGDKRPHDVDDVDKPLEEKLKSGLMAAYNERVGNTG